MCVYIYMQVMSEVVRPPRADGTCALSGAPHFLCEPAGTPTACRCSCRSCCPIVCMCLYIYVCMYITYMNMYVCMCIYTYTHTYVHTYIHTCIYIYIYRDICLSLYYTYRCTSRTYYPTDGAEVLARRHEYRAVMFYQVAAKRSLAQNQGPGEVLETGFLDIMYNSSDLSSYSVFGEMHADQGRVCICMYDIISICAHTYTNKHTHAQRGDAC